MVRGSCEPGVVRASSGDVRGLWAGGSVNFYCSIDPVVKKIFILDCPLSYADIKIKKFYVLNIIHYTVSMSRGKR